MFREMRRVRQQLPVEETEAILKRGTNGVLSVLGDEGYPYGVPVSYAYVEGKICFHCAIAGHKLDAIEAENKVCFTVVDRDEIHGEKLTTYFRSVIAFGRARLVTDPEEKKRYLLFLSDRYAMEYHEKAVEEMTAALDRTGIVVIEIEHMTGKEAIELVKERQ